MTPAPALDLTTSLRGDFWETQGATNGSDCAKNFGRKISAPVWKTEFPPELLPRRNTHLPPVANGGWASSRPCACVQAWAMWVGPAGALHALGMLPFPSASHARAPRQARLRWSRRPTAPASARSCGAPLGGPLLVAVASSPALALKPPLPGPPGNDMPHLPCPSVCTALVVPAECVPGISRPQFRFGQAVRASAPACRAGQRSLAGARTRHNCDATGVMQGCMGRGGGAPPPPLQGAQPMCSHCLPDGNCQLQWHL